MLTQTSGLRDVQRLIEGYRTELNYNPVDLLVDEAPTPGNSYFFRNTNYILLGLIIEEVSGTSYQNFLEQNFFEPLGMEDTLLHSHTRIIEHRAEGYVGGAKAQYANLNLVLASVGILTTVEDLYKWQTALIAGEIISQESWNMILANGTPLQGGSATYGMVLNNLQEPYRIVNGGSAVGYSWGYLAYPDVNLMVFILSNNEHVNSFGLASGIASVLVGD